ncbi:MAG TPA: AAA family ATPase [Micropepsaceae bacterium]|nr:AAA family ATPase [Micropepsaceae bacterium]
MKFARLRLSGFKSFVDATELHIEPGLTGIVGPNGCGKSNLLEAMRWVMGDNRPTSMRGSGMEDVIFSGAGNRPMRNNAEVSLLVDNNDRSVPGPYQDFDTIEITRRIERDAGSAYRINGREVRQRDVQLFFADGSTGAASPALVRQGQISILINQKPLARRAVLEEAAGISGLHQRRHEAELRLREAEKNLTRLNDIIGENESQLQALRRQARQATRYRNLSAQIFKTEALLFLLRWRDAELACSAATRAMEMASMRAVELGRAAEEAATVQAGRASVLPGLRQSESDCNSALQKLIHQRSDLEAEERRAREQAQRLRAHITAAEQDLGRERDMEQETLDAIGRLQNEESELRAAGDAAAETLAHAEERARAASAELVSRDQALERCTSQLAEFNASRASYESTKSQSAAQAEKAAAQKLTAEDRLRALQASVIQPAELSEAESAIEGAKRRAADARGEADAADARAAGLLAAETRWRGPLQEAEQNLQRLKAEASALARVLQPEAGGLWPPLIDSVKVRPEYESALAAALGDDLEAPLDVAAPRHWRDLGAIEALPPLPAGAPLSEFVDAPPALARRLSQTAVVTLDEGRAAQAHLKPGQRMVTQRGDLWRWDGYTSSADAKTQSAIRLEQRNRLMALDQELVTARDFRAAAAEELAVAQRATAAAQEAAREAHRILREAERAVAEAQDRAARIALKAAEGAGQIATLDAEIRALADQQASALKSVATADENIAILGDGTDLVAALEDAKRQSSAARATEAEARANLQHLTAEARSRNERLTGVARDLSQWSARSAAAARHIETLAARMAAMAEELAVADAVPAEIETRRETLADAIANSELALQLATNARVEAEAALADSESAAKAAQQALAEAREERAACSARSVAATERQSELLRRIRDELNASPDELAARAEADDSDVRPIEEIEKRVEKLKYEREQIGPVNLRVEEETREYETRLEALLSERNDLDGAIQRLKKGIQTLNREGREKLLESFDKVSQNFERLFGELFQGGEAKLTLVDSEEPLEAGLEIIAKPPGKKPTTLSLLSGGEQALTAIALIFAVFLVNPAPICVLDEVDAPLDDANVDRFCRLLDEMRRMGDTRYLVITHHALTMSRMDRLFGVTMQERGVSRLVSVSLTEAEQVIAA